MVTGDITGLWQVHTHYGIPRTYKCLFTSDVDPDSFGSVDPDSELDPDSEFGSGSRGIKRREKQSLNQIKSSEKRPEEQAEGGHHRRHPLDES